MQDLMCQLTSAYMGGTYRLEYADVITNFSGMDSLPNFLIIFLFLISKFSFLFSNLSFLRELRSRALRAREELRYKTRQ